MVTTERLTVIWMEAVAYWSHVQSQYLPGGTERDNGNESEYLFLGGHLNQNLSKSRNITHWNVEASTLSWCFHPGVRCNVMCTGNSGTTVRANQLHMHDIHLRQRIWKFIQQVPPKGLEQSTGTYSVTFQKIIPQVSLKDGACRSNWPRG